MNVVVEDNVNYIRREQIVKSSINQIELDIKSHKALMSKSGKQTKNQGGYMANTLNWSIEALVKSPNIDKDWKKDIDRLINGITNDTMYPASPSHLTDRKSGWLYPADYNNLLASPVNDNQKFFVLALLCIGEAEGGAQCWFQTNTLLNNGKYQTDSGNRLILSDEPIIDRARGFKISQLNKYLYALGTASGGITGYNIATMRGYKFQQLTNIKDAYTKGNYQIGIKTAPNTFSALISILGESVVSQNRKDIRLNEDMYDTGCCLHYISLKEYLKFSRDHSAYKVAFESLIKSRNVVDSCIRAVTRWQSSDIYNRYIRSVNNERLTLSSMQQSDVSQYLNWRSKGISKTFKKLGIVAA